MEFVVFVAAAAAAVAVAAAAAVAAVAAVVGFLNGLLCRILIYIDEFGYCVNENVDYLRMYFFRCHCRSLSYRLFGLLFVL